MASTDYMPVYQGNAALGVGSGAAGVLPDVSTLAPIQKAVDTGVAAQNQALQDRLKLIGDTHKTIALLDNEWAVKQYTQKIADRDNMYKSFMDGNAAVKDYLPEDSKVLKTFRDKYNDAYQKWSKNINDRDAAKEFKVAQDDLNDVAARLATRYATKVGGDNAIAGMALSEDKIAQQENQIKWLNETDEDGKPSLPSVYQKFAGYDANAFNSQAAIKTVNVRSKDGLYDIPVSTFEYAKTKKKVEDNSLEGNTGSIANRYLHTYWEQYTPQQREFLVQQSKEATDAHNAAHPTDLAEPISVSATGQLLDSPQDFAAKMLLLQNPDAQGQPVGNEFALKVKAEKDKTAIDWDKNAIDWAKLTEVDKPKAKAQIKLWDSKTNGSTETKNEALNFAGSLYGQMKQLADKNGVITPDKVRQLTSEQLKYLGKYGQVTDKDNNTTKGLNPLFKSDDGTEDKNSYLIQLDGDKIKVMKDPKLDKKTGRWTGNWDNTKTTTLTNIATNRVNEENQMAGGKEINDYIGIDNPAEQGKGETSKTETKSSGYQAKMPDGSLITSEDGVTWYDKDGNEVK